MLYYRATKHVWLFDYKRASGIEPVYIEAWAPKGAIGFGVLRALRYFIHKWAFLVGNAQHFRDDRQIALLVRALGSRHTKRFFIRPFGGRKIVS
jgi:hypothetical protein